MSDNEEKLGHQGRPWKVEATCKDYEQAKSLSEKLTATGLESKVKLTSSGYTVRTRQAVDTSSTDSPKSKNKNK